jgi:hypothetical protein
MRSKEFKKVSEDKQKLDKALEVAQIQRLYAAAAKDRQDVSESIQESFSPLKKK